MDRSEGQEKRREKKPPKKDKDTETRRDADFNNNRTYIEVGIYLSSAGSTDNHQSIGR